MAENGITDKVVENKLLIIAGRIGGAVLLLALPFTIGWLFGMDNRIYAVERTIAISEVEQNSTEQSLSKLADQVVELQRQNILVLQAIARLETKLEQPQ